MVKEQTFILRAENLNYKDSTPTDNNLSVSQLMMYK